MSDSFELIKVDIEEFKESVQVDIDEEESEVKEDSFLKPDPIDYEDAIRESKVMLDDFSKESSVKMVVFKYQGYYQVDVVNGPKEYEIYNHLYNAEDVVSFVSWNSNEKEVYNLNQV